MDLSDDDFDVCDDISEMLKDIFVDECVYETMDFIIHLKESVPYLSCSSTKNIMSNLENYLKNKKIDKKVINFKTIKDEEIFVYFFCYVNNIIEKNKKLYKVNENYELTLKEFIYLVN